MNGGSISPMITSMKSTHESGPFKHSVVRLYSSFARNNYIVKAVLIWGNTPECGMGVPLASILSGYCVHLLMESTQPFERGPLGLYQNRNSADTPANQ